MKTTMKGQYVFAAALLAAGLSSAQAAVIFSDNFDTDAASTSLNFSAFNNWTVSNGTVDYIRSGGYGINCVGGTGGCVDMDGSTGNAGRLTSKTVFSFDPGVTYTFSVMVSGNQRGGTDSLALGVEGDGSVTISGIAASDPFTALVFSPIAAFSGRLFIDGVGGDNIGPIADNAVLSDSRSTALPEPGPLGLLALTLAGVAVTLRKRQ